VPLADGAAKEGLKTVQTFKKSKYGKLLEETARSPAQPVKAPEVELDSLIDRIEQRQKSAADTTVNSSSLENLRNLLLQELIPAFMELSEKYSCRGISMRMDPSGFLQGDRGWDFEFAYNGYKSCLQGTVTSDMVAFEETRYAPNLGGELVSGPVLRVRTLNSSSFRDFVCERLALLLKTAVRRA